MLNLLRKNFAIRATPQSVSQGRVSVLALLECIVCTGSLAAVWKFTNLGDYVLWIVLSTPLLMLRTNRASIEGTEWINRAREEDKDYARVEREMRRGGDFNALDSASGPYVTALAHLAGRVFPVVKQCFLNPGECISVIPDNWRRNVLLVDGGCDFEVLPVGPDGPSQADTGSQSHIDALPPMFVWIPFAVGATMVAGLYLLSEVFGQSESIFVLLISIPLAFLGMIGCVLLLFSGFFMWLRYAPKATFLIYFPLVLISARAFPKNKTAIQFVQDLSGMTTAEYKPHPRETVARVLAIGVLVVTLSVYAILMVLDRLYIGLQDKGIPDTILIELGERVPDYAITTYTLAGLMSVVLTLLIWYVARLVAHHSGLKHPPAMCVLNALRVCLLVRGGLSIILIPNAIYLVAVVIGEIELPSYLHDWWRW